MYDIPNMILFLSRAWDSRMPVRSDRCVINQSNSQKGLGPSGFSPQGACGHLLRRPAALQQEAGGVRRVEELHSAARVQAARLRGGQRHILCKHGSLAGQLVPA